MGGGALEKFLPDRGEVIQAQRICTNAKVTKSTHHFC